MRRHAGAAQCVGRGQRGGDRPGALDVSPITLLMPETARRSDLVEVTGRPPESAENVWDWLRARHLRRGALALTLRRHRPDV